MEVAPFTSPKIGGASEAGPAATEMSFRLALSLAIAMMSIVYIVGSVHIFESVRTGRFFELDINAEANDIDSRIDEISCKLLSNPVIESFWVERK